MRVSIFGMGYVGAVSGACLAELGHEIIGVDVNADKVASINQGQTPVVEDGVPERIQAGVASGRIRATTDAREAVENSDMTFISVGTPSDANGSVSLQAIDAVSAEIGVAISAKDTAHTVVVRSTVPPGTTEDHIAPALSRHSGRQLGGGLEVGFNPEFLREGAAVRDFFNPPFTVGGSVGPGGYDAIEAVYKGVEAPFVRTSCRVAESIKYLSNSFHAVKITFANELGTLLKHLGMDSREALELFRQDRELNISPAYLRPGFAFGGSCLPKELRAIQAMARKMDLDLPMLGNVMAANGSHIDRAFTMITRGGRRKVALFGLAFKPGTDDLRESPLVTLAERLIGKGYELTIYDRSLEIGRLVGANRDFIEREIPHLDRLLAKEPAAALDGAEVIVVGHAPADAVDAIKAAARGRTIVDLAGLDALKDLPETVYEGICW